MTVAIALLVAALMLCFMEIFVPSLGVLTVMGLACAAGSCIAAFRHGSTAGATFVALNAIGVPGAFVLAFKLLPHSPLAHKKSAVEDSTYEPIQSLDGLEGASGVAFTDLRPGGTALIGERKIDVVARGGYIEEGTKIKVLKVEGTKVVVEKETV